MQCWLSPYKCCCCRYMAELSKHVPIIPVIMKADTMTIHEAQRFRQEVVNRLQNPGAARPRQPGLMHHTAGCKTQDLICTSLSNPTKAAAALLLEQHG